MNRKKLLIVILIVVSTGTAVYIATKNKLTPPASSIQNGDEPSEQTDTTATNNNNKGDSADPNAIKSDIKNSDLQEKTRLIYQADLSQIKESDKQSAIAGARDVIERRVDSYGVSESNVQILEGDRIMVEMAEVRDLDQTIKMIEENTLLEFKEEMTDAEKAAIREQYEDSQIPEEYLSTLFYKATGLNGAQLDRADVLFDSRTYAPEVQLQFDTEGTRLFSEITSRNIGRKVAVFLDGTPISIPTVEAAITDGKAVLSGNFTLEEAKTLAQRLNAGALPVSISLISQQTVDASSE